LKGYVTGDSKPQKVNSALFNSQKPKQDDKGYFVEILQGQKIMTSFELENQPGYSKRRL
jgi:hypothetical protein